METSSGPASDATLGDGLISMFTSISPYPFASWKGKRCVIIGFVLEGRDRLRPVVGLLPSGDMIVAEGLCDVKMDLSKIVDLSKPPPGDEWKEGDGE